MPGAVSAETRFGRVKNPYYDDFVMGSTWIMVEEDSECIFFGRVTECELEFNLDKTVTADGILNELGRSTPDSRPARTTAARNPVCFLS